MYRYKNVSDLILMIPNVGEVKPNEVLESEQLLSNVFLQDVSKLEEDKIKLDTTDESEGA